MKELTHFMKKIATNIIFLLVTIAVPIFSLAQNDSSGYFTSFDGTKIYYEVKGKGQPIVLVHGFIVNGESWKRTPLYKDLLEQGFKVITMDLRGNGKSDKPHTVDAYGNDAEAKDVMGLLEKLGIKSYKLVGYSRGSIIVARLLVKDKNVQSAVMGGMGDGFTDPNWPRRLMFYRALMGEPVKELEDMVKYVKESGLDQQALAYLQKEQPSTTPDVLAKVKQKVLVISGDNDPDNGSTQALTKMMPAAELKIVPGDHGSTLRSAEFSVEVIAFLQRN